MITLVHLWIWFLIPDPPGTITLFRTKEYWGSGYEIRLNGETLINQFKSQHVVTFQLPPGAYWLESKKYDSQTSRLRLEVKSGQHYYIRGIEDNDFLLRALHLRNWPESKAIPLLQPLKKQSILHERLDRIVAQ